MNFTYIVPSFDQIDLDKKAHRQAAFSALKKVIRSAEVQANKTIRSRYNLKRVQIDKMLNSKAGSMDDLTAIIQAKGPAIPIIAFVISEIAKKVARGRGVRVSDLRTLNGVDVEISKGIRKTLKHAFVAYVRGPLPSGVTSPGHLGIFMRRANGSRWTQGRPHTSSPNLPIDQKFTISIASMFGSAKVLNDVDAYLAEHFPDVLAHELDYYLNIKK